MTFSLARPGPACLAVAVFSLGLQLWLFAHSSLDDNRLTSWQWVMAGTPTWRLTATLLGALLLAWLLSGLDLPNRLPPWGLFFGLFIPLALLWPTPEVVLDAARYFVYGQYAADHGLLGLWRAWGTELAAWTDLPAVPFLFGLVRVCLGDDRLLFQALNLGLFCLTALLTRGLGRMLMDQRVGGLAGLLLAAFPFALAQTPLLLADIPVMFLFTLALYTLARLAMGGGRVWLPLAGLALGLALLAKYSLWPFLTPAVLLPWAWTRERRTRLALLLALLLGAGVLGAFLLAKGQVALGQMALLREYQWGGLERWGESPVSTFIFQTHPLLSLAALYGCYMVARTRDRRWLPLLLMLVIALWLGGRRSRYLIPVLPLISLLAAYGLAQLRPARAGNFAALTAALTSMALAICLQMPFLRQTGPVNLQAAGRYLNALPFARVRVFTAQPTPQVCDLAVCVPLLALYTHKPLCYEEALCRLPPGRDISRSSLRFTWEQRLPASYACPAPNTDQPEAWVVIAAQPLLPDALRERLAGRELAAAFATDNQVFALRTLVYVYLDSPP